MFRFFRLTSGPIGLGQRYKRLDLLTQARSQDNTFLDLRLLRGHVTRLCQDSLGLETPSSVMEVSFAVLVALAVRRFWLIVRLLACSTTTLRTRLDITQFWM